MEIMTELVHMCLCYILQSWFVFHEFFLVFNLIKLNLSIFLRQFSLVRTIFSSMCDKLIIY